MANKINVKLILELRKAGISRNAIAAARHMLKNSVSEVIRLSDELGITCDDVSGMDPDSVYRMFYPDKYAAEHIYADPGYEYVHKELTRTGVNLKLDSATLRLCPTFAQ